MWHFLHYEYFSKLLESLGATFGHALAEKTTGSLFTKSCSKNVIRKREKCDKFIMNKIKDFLRSRLLDFLLFDIKGYHKQF